MKKIVGITLALILSVFFITGCSSAKNDLNGSYVSDNGNSIAELEIDNADALITILGQSMNGTIDHSKKTILFKDKDDSIKFNYKMVGDKLSLESDDAGTMVFEKKSNNNKNVTTENSKDSSEETSVSSSKEEISETPSTSSENDSYAYEDYFTLSIGEYEVGTDIKPGSYDVDFSFFDFSDENKEDGSGYIEITRNGDTKKYDFANSDVEQRIILKDGDFVNSVPENSDSEFNFYID